MKCLWALIVVLGMSVSVQAAPSMMGAHVTIIADKYGTLKHPMQIRFFMASRENGDHVRAVVRFYIPKNNPADAVTKGRCVLLVNNEPMAGFGEYWIAGKNGRDLWFSSLEKKDRVILAVFWDHESPMMEYATIETESQHGTAMNMWESAQSEWFFYKNPDANRASYYREFSLDEVCVTKTYDDLLAEARELIAELR